MNTKTLSERAQSVIDQYLHFKVGVASCSVPYYNNKTTATRIALRAHRGKGSPKEIYEEVEALLVKKHIDSNSLTNSVLKQLLVDNGLGIDCSGFAFYVLNAESLERKHGSLSRHLFFVQRTGFISRLRSKLRPAENCNVATLASHTNSRALTLTDIEPGDMITLLGDGAGVDRDHILLIHQVDYQNFVPTRIHYTDAIAYPEDGLYGSGVRQGTIQIMNSGKNILEQHWTENNLEGEHNPIFVKAQKSKTEIRRLNWFN